MIWYWTCIYLSVVFIVLSVLSSEFYKFWANWDQVKCKVFDYRFLLYISGWVIAVFVSFTAFLSDNVDFLHAIALKIFISTKKDQFVCI